MGETTALSTTTTTTTTTEVTTNFDYENGISASPIFALPVPLSEGERLERKKKLLEADAELKLSPNPYFQRDNLLKVTSSLTYVFFFF